jgi:hypothetical protein
MDHRYKCVLPKLSFSILLISMLGLITNLSYAQQSSRPFSIELNAGGGLIGNSTTNTAFQPELGLSYMPGRWGVGLNAGIYSFDSGFSADQYRTGYEQFTVTEASENQWEAFYINVGPRFEQSLSRFVSMNLGLDLAMTNQEAPSQSVRFNDTTGELESSGIDSDIVLAEMEAEESGGWTAAIRPQMQFEFKPGFSDRFSFNIKTGIQHHLSDREITYTERDLSRVMQVDNVFEMYSQYENAPVVQRTETAPKTNFFANAGIKISFGGSSAPAAPGQDYNSSRSNKPGGSIANDGGGDCDDGDPRCTPDGSRAKDYNSSRSNKPRSEAALDDVVIIKGEGLTAVDSFIDEIIEVLDRCEDEVCTQVRQNADGRVDKHRQVRQGQISQDQGIEDIHSIVTEDVVSLQKCESDVCREVLTKEVQLLEHMNVLMSLVQSGRAAAAQDYNAARSNKPTSSAADGGNDQGEGAGQQVVLITQDGDGKVYAWGGEPEAIMQDENGKLYSWGLAPKTSAGGDEGKVYSWGVASSASLQNGDGEVYCWGDNSRASLMDGSGEVYCWGDNSGASVDSCEGDMCPQPDHNLYLAKELGLASVGDDIEDIKQVLDRCDEGVCGQVRQHADERHHGVTRAQENPSEFDMHIEEILSIVKEDVESLGRCETEVCREVLAMEENLLVKMNRLSDLAQVAPARDYNSSRSNKPSSRAADIGDGDMDSDDDGIDDGVDFTMARLANPSGVIVKTGMVASGGNPLYSSNSNSGENPLDEGQANDGDSDNNEDSLPVQKFDLQPGSYCVALSTMKISTNSQQSIRSGAQNSKPDMDEDGFPEIMKSASFSISKRSARTGRNPSGDEDMDSDGDGIHFDLEIDPNDEDSDDDGVLDGFETASYSISKRSARTGRNVDSELETMESKEGVDPNANQTSETESTDDVYQWSYNLNELEGGSDLPTGGTLTVLFTGGEWHFDLEVDPLDLDDDGDGLAEMFQNSSFSISKRSARTGRN